MEAVRVVFFCDGASPALGAVTGTRCSPGLGIDRGDHHVHEDVVGEGPCGVVLYQSTSRGILNDTKLSGMDAGLMHMDAPKAHPWSSVELKASTAGNAYPGALVRCRHLWVMPDSPLAACTSKKKVPWPALRCVGGFRTDRAIRVLPSPRKVAVLVVDRNKPEVHVLQKGVVVGAVGGDGEVVGLLKVDGNLYCARV
eukprot:3572657-Rhodomonas_salina.5